MAVIRWTSFAGENRALHPKLLPDSVGTLSRNQKPGRGDLRPWKNPVQVATVPSGRQTIYRMGRDVASDSTYWLSWPGTVHAVRGFDAEDTTERTYYTGDGIPKVTSNLLLDGTNPQDNPGANWRPLGIPAPAAAPILSVTSAAAVEGLGKHRYFIAKYAVEMLETGDILRFTVGEQSTQTLLTLTAGEGGSVTLSSLSAQISTVGGLTASVTAADSSNGEGVLILSEAVDTQFLIEKKDGTISDYDPAKVTYTSWYSVSFSAASSAQSIVKGERYKIKSVGSTDFIKLGAKSNTVGLEFAATANGNSESGNGTVTSPAKLTVINPGENMDPGQRFAVTVGNSPPVSLTLTAGPGTYPSEVTAETFASAFNAIDGLQAKVAFQADGVTKYTQIETDAISDSDTALGFSVKKITPVQSDRFVRVGESSEITQPSASEETYYYVYTYVNDWGWESAPSPVSAMLTRATDATTTITGFAEVPSGNYNVNRIRLYRTQTGTSGSTEFFFLREEAYGTTSTTDDNRDLGEVLPTTTWLPAPGVPMGNGSTETALSNLTSLWNGMLAGISGNSVRLCEAYTPYAWPIAYDMVPPDSKPVALGVFGQSLLVLTTGRPLLVAGSSPDSMDQQPLEMPQGCVAPRSVVSMGSGVAWASEDGLCWYGSGGARILTAGLMMREDWQALKPETIIGKMYEGLYFGSYDDGSGRKGFMIEPGNPKGIFFLDAGYEAMHFDELKDQLYVLDGTSVKKWDAGTAMTCKAKSKQFWTPKPINFSAAEVVADNYPVTCRVYADGALKHTQSVVSNKPFRLPSGFLAQRWELEIEGTSAVQSVAIASAVAELAQV